MRVTVELSINASAEAIFTVLCDAGLLESLLPEDSELVETAPNTYDFLLQKQTSLITLKLPGTLQIEPADGTARRFVVHAKHILAGSIDMQATMTCQSAKAPNLLTCVAELEGTGIIRQLMASQEDRAERILRNVLNGVKYRAEALSRRVPEAPTAV